MFLFYFLLIARSLVNDFETNRGFLKINQFQASPTLELDFRSKMKKNLPKKVIQHIVVQMQFVLYILFSFFLIKPLANLVMGFPLHSFSIWSRKMVVACGSIYRSTKIIFQHLGEEHELCSKTNWEGSQDCNGKKMGEGKNRRNLHR